MPFQVTQLFKALTARSAQEVICLLVNLLVIGQLIFEPVRVPADVTNVRFNAVGMFPEAVSIESA